MVEGKDLILKEETELMDRSAEVEYFLSKLEDAHQSLGKRTSPVMQWFPEIEDDSRVRFMDRHYSDGIPTLAQATTDAESGILVWAGLPNSGKSTELTNMEVYGLERDPDFMVVDMSFDDDYKKRYQQWIAAMTGLRYQEITTDVGLSEDKARAKEAAYRQLRAWVEQDRLRIYDGDYPLKDKDGNVIRRINMRKLDNIMSVMRQVRKSYPGRKPWMFVDVWNDLDIQSSKYGSENADQNIAVNNLKQCTQDTQIPVAMSCHLRKTQGRRATLEDLKGTSGLGYAAVFVAIYRNELRENAVVDPLVFEDDQGRIWPVGVTDIVKTKISSCDRPLFHTLYMDRCGLGFPTRAQYIEWETEYMGGRK
jgi:replicative DNA helicase